MAGNHVLLETISLTQAAASVVFDNIPQSGYTDLKVVVSTRDNNNSWVCNMQFNGTNGTSRYLQGNGSGAESGSQGDMRFIVNGSSSTANTFGNAEIYIPNYTSNTNKSVSIDCVSETNGTTAYMRLIAALWSNTAAITSITFLSLDAATIPANSTFSLYGVAAVGTTPTVAPKATGGNIVANDGTYWYHAFLTSGTFTPQTALTCDYLVVAGGGGGGGHNAAGGGGGGLRSTVGATGGGGSLETALSLVAQNYTVTIGAGGAGANDARGVSGSNSVFSTITSIGGAGGGGNNGGQAPVTGGSGGGGATADYGNNVGSAGTANQGYAGGGGAQNSGGGGGGAGAVGSNASGGNGGNGGAGVSLSAWATPTSTGVSNFYAGGGGGSSFSGSQGSGGSGGGTQGSYDDRVNAANNTGGGGGGRNRTSGPAANGGSGIVIIRYAMA